MALRGTIFVTEDRTGRLVQIRLDDLRSITECGSYRLLGFDNSQVTYSVQESHAELAVLMGWAPPRSD